MDNKPQPVIFPYNDRILFVHHSFGLTFQKMTRHKRPRKYVKLGTIANLNPRFNEPKTQRVYGIGCYFEFCYVEDKTNGEWYTYPPSEIVVNAMDVIDGKIKAIDWLRRKHDITNPFVFKVRNGQQWRRLQVWFADNDIGYKFRLFKEVKGQ